MSAYTHRVAMTMQTANLAPKPQSGDVVYLTSREAAEVIRLIPGNPVQYRVKVGNEIKTIGSDDILKVYPAGSIG